MDGGIVKDRKGLQVGGQQLEDKHGDRRLGRTAPRLERDLLGNRVGNVASKRNRSVRELF